MSHGHQILKALETSIFQILIRCGTKLSQQKVCDLVIRNCAVQIVLLLEIVSSVEQPSHVIVRIFGVEATTLKQHL